MNEIAGRPDLCAKILRRDRRTEAKYDKVEAMVARPPAGAYDGIEGFPVLTWPRALLYSSRQPSPRTFMGYVMVRVTPRDFVPFFQLTTTHRRQSFGGNSITWDRLVLLAMRLCHVIRTLHRFGYAVGDMNDRNVLVSRRLTPLVMDTDSFQVPKPRKGHFPSIMGDQMYWAPELLDVDFATYRESRELGDRYALGILLFQLFMNGMRPYQARGSSVDHLQSLAEKTRAGCYAWTRPRPGVLEPPGAAPDYFALPGPVRAAFERCFVAGHRRPQVRPSADEWYQALAKVREAGFQTCKVSARHVYGKGNRECPWCLDPNDPFGAAKPMVKGPRKVVEVKVPRRSGGPPGPGPPRTRPTRAATTAKAPARPTSARAKVRAQPTPSLSQRRRRPPQLTIQTPRVGIASLAPPVVVPTTGAHRATQSAPWKEKSVQVLWLGLFALACASPALILREVPFGIEVKVTATVVAILFVFLLGAAAAWPTLRSRRGRLSRNQVYVLGAWLILATTVGIAAAAAGRWQWLLFATSAAAWTAGLVAFILLERGTPEAFKPTPRGVFHAAVGLACAYIPILFLWGWSQV